MSTHNGNYYPIQKHQVGNGITDKLTYGAWQKSNETAFLFTQVLIFFNINVIHFKIVPLGSYPPMETLFPLLVGALEVFIGMVFSMSVTLFWIFSKVPK